MMKKAENRQMKLEPGLHHSLSYHPTNHSSDKRGKMKPTSRIIMRAVAWIALFLFLGVLPGACAPFLAQAGAQLHPPEIRSVYPLGGAPGAVVRVTVSGVSFRGGDRVLFDKPGIMARILPSDLTKQPAPTLESDGNPDVVAEFTVAKDTAPGVYSFRIVTPNGLSSVGKWVVGRDLPTVEAKEPNDTFAQAQAVSLPIAVNGRLQEVGDQDNFAFDLEAGKTFVAEVTAAVADSPLDSLLILRDADGREIVENDNYNGPDSLLIFRVKKSGRYLLTLTSAVGAGDPNAIYCLSLGYLPVLKAIFPAGVEQGKSAALTLIGVNLPMPAHAEAAANLPVGTHPFHLPTPTGQTNARPLLVSTLPTLTPPSPGHDRLHATLLPVPGTANGRFFRTDGKPGEVLDFYKFHAQAGHRYVMQVQCAALGSLADPVLTLYDSAGKQLDENDDADGPDSRLERTFDQAGDFLLRVKEVKGATGPDLVYRLVVQDAPPPGFSLATETRGRAVGRGDSVPFEVNVTRDRWDGPVTLGFADLPEGVTGTTCVVPAGVGQGLIVLTADKDAPQGAFPLHIVGTAQVNGQSYHRTLESASDWIWKGGERTTSPVPTGLLLYAVAAPFEIAPQIGVHDMTLPRGQSVKIGVRVEKRVAYKKPITLRLMGLPEGAEAAEVTVPADKDQAEIELKIKTDARLGTFPVVVTAVATNGQNVQLDRVTPPFQLTITEAPKKSASR